MKNPIGGRIGFMKALTVTESHDLLLCDVNSLGRPPGFWTSGNDYCETAPNDDGMGIRRHRCRVVDAGSAVVPTRNTDGLHPAAREITPHMASNENDDRTHNCRNLDNYVWFRTLLPLPES